MHARKELEEGEPGDPLKRFSIAAAAFQVEVSFNPLWEKESEGVLFQIPPLLVEVQESCKSRSIQEVLLRSPVIEYLLSDDVVLQDLNLRYRGNDAPTNVLSFPQESQDKGSVLGSVVLSYETTHREAREQRKPFIHHVLHLVLHGTLHLLGCDHETKREADIMENLERAILASLDIPDPYCLC
ncbi:MAG: rRNA maturation RNase YbeY [Holosporales bacterium]|nr:rRNA maturation RNase YbeY [Holosporales bacterium]